MRRSHASRFVVVVLLVTAAVAIIVPSAYAATYTVTKTADTLDGTCDADCSLREAVAAANTTVGADIVKVPAGSFMITRAGVDDTNVNGDLDSTDPAGISIHGASRATTMVDGGDLDRVLDVTSGSLTLTDATLTNGSATAAGGALRFDDFSSNFIATNLSITNSATNGGSSDGGGAWITASYIEMHYVELASNSAANNGGGAFLEIRGGGNFSTLDGLSIHHNTAGADGGGLYTNAFSAMYLTLYANHAGGNGGGIRAYNGVVSGLERATIDGNVADSDAVGGGAGGAVWNETGTLVFKSSILGTNNVGSGALNSCAGSGAFASTGYNLFRHADSCGTAPATGDQLGVDPKLTAFGPAGGPGMPMFRLDAGSPAIDAGGTGCAGGFDGRGSPREVGAACDAGAFESRTASYRVTSSVTSVGATSPRQGATVSATFVVTNLSAYRQQDATLTISLPTSLAATVTPPNGASACAASTTTTWTCAVPLLSQGFTATYQVTFTANWTSTRTLAGRVDSVDTDTDAADNATAKSITVIPPVIPKIRVMPILRNTLTASSGIVKVKVTCPAGVTGAACRTRSTLKTTTKVLVGRQRIFVSAPCKALNVPSGRTGYIVCTFGATTRAKLLGKILTMRLTIASSSPDSAATTTTIVKVLIPKPIRR